MVFWVTVKAYVETLFYTVCHCREMVLCHVCFPLEFWNIAKKVKHIQYRMGNLPFRLKNGRNKLALWSKHEVNFKETRKKKWSSPSPWWFHEVDTLAATSFPLSLTRRALVSFWVHPPMFYKSLGAKLIILLFFPVTGFAMWLYDPASSARSDFFLGVEKKSCCYSCYGKNIYRW